MYEKLLFLVYVATLIFISSISNKVLLISAILFLIGISLKDALKISKKVIISVVFFTGTVSAFYLIVGIFKDNVNIDYLIVVNLRVFALTYLTTFVFSKLNLFKVFSFSKDLYYVLILTYSQILSYKKLYEEVKMFMKSRVVKKLSFNDYLKFYGYLTMFFFDKSLKNSREVSQAMKSRGFFND